MAKKKQIEENIAVLINTGKIKNLADVNWEKETHFWTNAIAREIIENIDDAILKPAIIDVMRSEWNFNHEKDVLNWPDKDIEFPDFLDGLKKHIENYERFNIDVIKEQRTKELSRLKEDVERLKRTVFHLSKELNTDEANKYFSNAIEAGFMDNSYQWNGTKYQAALFAEICSEKLNLRYKWKPFETLWNMKGLAQTRRESKERFGKVGREKEIIDLFN